MLEDSDKMNEYILDPKKQRRRKSQAVLVKRPVKTYYRQQVSRTKDGHNFSIQMKKKFIIENSVQNSFEE